MATLETGKRLFQKMLRRCGGLNRMMTMRKIPKNGKMQVNNLQGDCH